MARLSYEALPAREFHVADRNATGQDVELAFNAERGLELYVDGVLKGSLAPSGTRVALPVSTSPADGILLGDISLYRSSSAPRLTVTGTGGLMEFAVRENVAEPRGVYIRGYGNLDITIDTLGQGSEALDTFFQNEQNPRWFVRGDGEMGWGPGGMGGPNWEDVKLKRPAVGILALLGTSDAVGATLEFFEQTDAPAPSANKARLYARDNGSGKTQLCARFATGAIQVLATEP